MGYEIRHAALHVVELYVKSAFMMSAISVQVYKLASSHGHSPCFQCYTQH